MSPKTELKYEIDPVDYARMRVRMFAAISDVSLPEWARELLDQAYDTLTIMQTKQWTCETPEEKSDE